MDYKVINTTEEMDALKQAWEELEEYAIDATYYLTYRFNYAKWSILSTSPDYSLFIICVYQNGVIISIAPLIRHRVKKKLITFIKLEFLALGDYANFLVDSRSDVKTENIYDGIFDVIESNFHLWDEISLTHISHKTKLASYLLKSKRNINLLYLIENPYIRVQDCCANDEVKSEIFPEKTLQYARRLKKITDYELIYTTKNMIPEFAGIHLAEKQYLNESHDKTRHSLYEESDRQLLLEKLFEQGDGTAYYLLDKNKEKIIIYNFGFIYNKVFYSINTAFDPDYGKYGVGKVLYYEILLHNMKNRLWDILDSGAGRYQWKFEWTSKFNLLYQYKVINSSSKKLILFQKIQAIKNILMHSGKQH